MHGWIETFHERLTIGIADGEPELWARHSARTAAFGERPSQPRDGAHGDDASCTQVVLWGELDLDTSGWAREVFDHALDEVGEGSDLTLEPCDEGLGEPVRSSPRWLVDTAGLRFLSLSGLRVLEHTALRCQHAGGQLVIVHPSRPVRQVLAFAGRQDGQPHPVTAASEECTGPARRAGGPEGRSSRHTVYASSDTGWAGHISGFTIGCGAPGD